MYCQLKFRKVISMKFKSKYKLLTVSVYNFFKLRPSSSMTGSVRTSVRLSVRLSVCRTLTPISLGSHHHIIMKFSGVITMDKRDVHTKGQGQRSKVKVTEVKTQLSHFWTVTPAWIHIYDKITHTAWGSIEEVPYCFSRSSVKFQGHRGKICLFWPQFGISGL